MSPTQPTAEVRDRGQPARCVDPGQVQDDAERGPRPDGDETDDSGRPAERDERECRVRPGDEDEDHRVVEPSGTETS